MIKFPVALQLYSVRDEMANDFEGTLKAVKSFGYDGVEFAGLYGKSAEEIKELCAKYDLIPVSAHVPLDDMKNNPDIINCYKEIGCSYIVIPYLTPEYRPGNEKFSEVIKWSKILGEKANALGIKLAYHNHDFEFAKIDGQYALDILYSEVPEHLLQPQIDTCWVNVGGENPAEYIRKYKGRVEIVHLKDFVGSKTENMYALIGIKEENKKDFDQKFEFRPVGYGVQNFNEILAAADEVNAKWVVVEQDSPSLEKTPLECAQMSINYLKSL